jgi:predicted MFS family arabinose efflux permease
VSRLAWAGVLGVPVFLVIAVALGWRLPSWATTLAVVALFAGFATLVTRLRGHDPHDPDDGAVV